MSTFNQNFFQPKREYTREMAEARLVEKGFSDFTFTGCSFSSGASFYFDGPKGEKIRVSDHALTGNRAFDVIQVRFEEPVVMDSPLKVRQRYLEGEITKKEYRQICKEKGFIFKP